MERKPRPKADHEGYGESLEAAYERYLRELGLTEQDLVGKTILDVGAGSAGFAAAVEKRGIGAKVISVEDNPLRTERPPHTTSGYVRAEAQHLPFADNTFDMVVSVYALPHVASVGKTYRGTPVESVREGVPAYKVTKEDEARIKEETTEQTRRAVAECIRVVKEGGEVRFGGVPVKVPEEELDKEGFPKLPRVLWNDDVMEGFDKATEEEFLAKYPEEEGENLFVIRKRTQEERPWPHESLAPGTPVNWEDIAVHPEFQEAAKNMSSLIVEIAAMEGETIRKAKALRGFVPHGEVTEEGAARFPLLDPGHEDGWIQVPAGYWRRNT